MKKKLTKKTFIQKSRMVHGDLYNYDKVIYTNNKSKVTITCKVHGDFEQNASSHYNMGRGCPKCKGGVGNIDTHEFIRRALEIHQDTYDYNKVHYVNSFTPVTIICKKHGEFQQNLINHIHHKKGCPKCKGGIRLTKKEFIERAREIHGDRYNYDLVIYRRSVSPVKIECPEHGIFEKSPNKHLSDSSGCPDCALRISKGESAVEDWLNNNDIHFIREYKIEECKNVRPLPFDFYLPDTNILIEYDGIQHYDKDNRFYSEQLEINDNIKTNYCIDNKIKLIKIPY